MSLNFLSLEAPKLEEETTYEPEQTVDSTADEQLPAAKCLKNTKQVKEQVKPTTSAAKITAAKERASRMFKERRLNATAENKEDCSVIEGAANTEWESLQMSAFSSTELLQTLEAQKQEIEELQTKLWQQKSGYCNTSYVYV